VITTRGGGEDPFSFSLSFFFFSVPIKGFKLIAMVGQQTEEGEGGGGVGEGEEVEGGGEGGGGEGLRTTTAKVLVEGSGNSFPCIESSMQISLDVS